MQAGLGGGPEGEVLGQPFADGAFGTDVVAGFDGLVPLMAGDFFELGEEVLPEAGFDQGEGRLGQVVLVFVALVGGEGEDEEFDHFGIGVNDFGRLGGVGRGHDQGATLGQVLPGQNGQVTAAGEVKVLGAGVNEGEEVLADGDGDGGLVWRTLFHAG